MAVAADRSLGQPAVGSRSVSSGTIDGFGSIFVNGIEYETDDAEIVVNGQAADESALRLGMVVDVSGDTMTTAQQATRCVSCSTTR